MSAEQTKREAYVEKVRKLLAKAEGASTSEEAETFFAKATELMTKWEIEEAELTENGEAHEVLVERIQLGSYSPVADSMAMQFVAEVFDIRVGFKPYSSGSPALIVLVGRKNDLARFHLLWQSLEIQMIRLMKEGEPGLGRNEMRKYRQSFKIAFAGQVSRRLRALRAEMVETQALVLVKTDVQDAADNVFGGRSKSRVPALSAAGFLAGESAASQADLGQKRVTS